MAVQELYERDFFEWTQRNAKLLNRGRFDAADIPHIAEELRDLGRRDRREVESYLTRLILHLLKWQMQPAKRTVSWENSIAHSRDEIGRIFKQSPSLRRHAAESVREAYASARRQASIQTRMPLLAFPPECPYTFAQILNVDFLPGD